MRTIIAGSRDITDLSEVEDAVYFSGFEISVVLSGLAVGVDQLAIIWAEQNNIPVEYYPADWDQYGRGAGFKRNAIMARKADQLIAVWDGKSHGTKHMIDIAKAMKLKVFVYECRRLDS